MKTVISETAQRDLEQIAEFIGADNPGRALSFLNELRRSCETIASSPYAFPLVPRYNHLGIRRRVHQAYLILYRIADDEIQVIHVAHGRRDLDGLLFRAGG